MHRFGTKQWQTKACCTKGVRTTTVNILRGSIRIPKVNFKFITQTLNPKLYKESSIKQFKQTINDILQILEYLTEDYNIITELTEEGNVHYHFWAVFKEHRNYIDYVEIIKCNFKFGFSKLSKDNLNKTMMQKQVDTQMYMQKDILQTYTHIRSKWIVANKSEYNSIIEENDVMDVDMSEYDKINN